MWRRLLLKGADHVSHFLAFGVLCLLEFFLIEEAILVEVHGLEQGDGIGGEFDVILKAYGFTIDVEEAMSPRDW